VSDFFIIFYLLDVLDLLFDLITIYLIAKSKKQQKHHLVHL